MRKILVIEDDIYISDLIKELLTQSGYILTMAFSGTEGLLCLKNEEFDLVILDLMLPGKTGQEVLQEIRTISQIPIIVLTAVADKVSIVSLLKDGANDYLTKPFNNDELLVRIEVQLRATNTHASKTMKFKDLVLDQELYDVYINGKAVEFSKREYEILECLMRNPKKVFTKNNLYETVWQEEFYGDDNTINVHVSKIRTKLANLNPDEEYIQTVWGIGFKMQE